MPDLDSFHAYRVVAKYWSCQCGTTINEDKTPTRCKIRAESWCPIHGEVELRLAADGVEDSINKEFILVNADLSDHWVSQATVFFKDREWDLRAVRPFFDNDLEFTGALIEILLIESQKFGGYWESPEGFYNWDFEDCGFFITSEEIRDCTSWEELSEIVPNELIEIAQKEEREPEEFEWFLLENPYFFEFRYDPFS